MSAVSEIVEKIEGKIVELLPSYKQLPYAYSIELNDRLADKNFAVKIGSATTTDGTNRAVTFDHEIDVLLSQKWLPKRGQGDSDLRDKISQISSDLETVYKELYKRPMAVESASLLIIAPLDLSAPDIDNDNNIVSITLTLSVKYRVAT
jgi:hypothetical protein